MYFNKIEKVCVAELFLLGRAPKKQGDCPDQGTASLEWAPKIQLRFMPAWACQESALM